MRESTTLKSGAVLEFGEPSFDEASELMEIFAAELLKVNVNLGDLTQYLGSDGDVSELLKDPNILNTLKNAVCQMLASKPFKASLIVCMKRSLLDGEKITKGTFEAKRADFIPVCWEVAKQTLLPFIGSLGLSFSASAPGAKSSPK